MKVIFLVLLISFSVLSQTKVMDNTKSITAFLSNEDSKNLSEIFGIGHWRTRYGSVILNCLSKSDCYVRIYKNLDVDGTQIEISEDYVYALIGNGHNLDLFYWEFFYIESQKLNFNTSAKYYFSSDNLLEIVCYKNSYKSVDNYECGFKILK